MNGWQRWLKAPQTHWLRRALFQVHLWAGIGLGLYVLTVGISGSALLLQSPFYSWFQPKTIDPIPDNAMPLEGEDLTARMQEVYAGYELGFTIEAYRPDDATYVVLNRNGENIPHYFNQYTGQDIGLARPWPIRTVEWLGNVHDDLLLGREGRRYNGMGALLFVLMGVSGLIIWWQGRSRWYSGFLINPFDRTRGLLWQLHSFAGFWGLLLMLAWGISGFQLGFPQYMNALVDWLDNDLTDGERPNSWLLFFRELHFASPGEGPVIEWLWIAASFIPTLLFVTGLILWWKRVVRRSLAKGSF